MKQFLQKCIRIVLNPVLSCFAPVISVMAKTGIGVEACLKFGCLPVPVHYYSPIPDIKELEHRKVWDKISELKGLNFNPSSQIDLMTKIAKEYSQECKWPKYPTVNPYQFYTENGSFTFGCAAILHCLIRYYKPHNVIEIGSGNSSLVIRKALALNNKLGEKSDYIIIDPYPSAIIEKNFSDLTQLIKNTIETVDIKIFERLKKNDILFIDSSHVSKIGSDVNFLILDVLPRLAPGSIIHFHDIGLPYEYPKKYATNSYIRMFWTEAYMLQAFLCNNQDFEILLAMRYLMTDNKDVFSKLFPQYDPSLDHNISSSFWIRKRIN